jgi:hypothetical protein
MRLPSTSADEVWTTASFHSWPFTELPSLMTRNVGDLHLHRFRKPYLKEIVQEGVRACCCLAPGHPVAFGEDVGPAYGTDLP